MDVTAGIAISLHLFLNGEYNAIHPYSQLESRDFNAGIYYNSESSLSTYASKDFDLGRGYELEIGAVTGYSTGNVLPMVRLKKGRYFVSPVMEEWDGERKVGIVTGIQF